MTVICLRDGIMAGDTEASCDGMATGRFRKIHRLKGGCVVGMCGTIGEMAAWLSWAENGFKKGRRPKTDDLTVMIADPDGDVCFVEGNGAAFILEGPFHAIGSGQWVAVGAMEAGASAEEAAKAACKHVHGCSEPVIALKV